MKNDIYKKILDHMGEAVWMGDREEKTIYANPKFLKLVGYTLEEIIGKESYLFWDEMSAKTVRQENKKRNTGKSSEYEGNLVSKSGEIIPVKITGTALTEGGTVGIMSDQREYLKRVQSESILFQAVEQSTDAIILLTPEGKINSWNTGAKYIFGYKKSIIGKHISKLFSGEDIKNLLQTDELINKYELTGIHKNNSKISVSITQTHIKQKNKKDILYYLLTCRDISNYRKIESEVRSKYQKIEEAYKELGIKKRQLDYINEFIAFAKAHNTDTKKICDYVVASIVMLSKVDGCEMLILDTDGKNLEIVSHIGFSDDWIGKKIIPYKDSITERSVKNNESIKIYDLHSETHYTRKNLARKNNLTSLLIVPLTFGDQCLGTLGLYTKADKKLEIFENEFIEKYARVISLALS